MIGAVATISVVEGKEKEFEEIAIKLVEAVNLEEEDNLFYRLYKKNSNTYIILEGYKDKESLDYHITTPHYKKYGKAKGNKWFGITFKNYSMMNEEEDEEL